MHRCNYVEAVCTGILVVCLGGCGTIIHGRDQTLHISSTPQGAEVLYDGAVRGITPCNISVSRRPLETVVVVKSTGHGEKSLEIRNGVSMWAMLGNLVFGGIPGWVIDAATGSFGAYYDDTYHVDLLVPSAAEAPPDEGRNQISQVPPRVGNAISKQSGWRRLQKGMTQLEVKKMVGEAGEISRGGKSVIWYYPDVHGGYLVFVDDHLHSWQAP